MIATVRNMRIAKEKHGNRVVMVDYYGNESSANPDDYWTVADDYVFMTDGHEDDEPCELVVPYSGFHFLDDDGNIAPPTTDER
jgi:hypothetical protein